MSGTASRYITGVPYGPGMGVGRYPSAASVMSPPGVRPGPGYTPPAIDAGGIAVDPRTGVVAPAALDGGDLDLTNLLLQAGLGVIGYAPQIYDNVSRLLGGPEELPTPPEFVSAEEAARLNGAEEGAGRQNVPGGVSGGYMVSPDGAPIGVDGFAVEPMGFTPGSMPDGFQIAPDGGLITPDGLPVDPQFGMGGQIAPDAVQSASFGPATGSYYGLFDVPVATNPIEGGLGSLGGVDIAGGLASAGFGALGGYAGSTLAKPGGEVGAGVGSSVGAIIGGALLAPFGLAPVGAFLGGMAGGAGGGQIGAAPTIGRNFSVMGTLGGDGQIYWGQGGGDNGGTAADAMGFANDFGGNLLQMASAQGLRFNPATAGAQFTIGGFDNFSRRYQTPGGYFYDPYNGGSPENYALRPEAGFDAFSPQQADAFTRAVLQDLAARNVFTPTGAGENLYNASAAGGLGFYGPQGLSYSDPAQGTAFQGNTGNFLTDVMYRQADLRAGNVMAQQAAAEQARAAAEWQFNNAQTGNPTMAADAPGAGYYDPSMQSGGA